MSKIEGDEKKDAQPRPESTRFYIPDYCIKFIETVLKGTPYTNPYVRVCMLKIIFRYKRNNLIIDTSCKGDVAGNSTWIDNQNKNLAILALEIFQGVFSVLISGLYI